MTRTTIQFIAAAFVLLAAYMPAGMAQEPLMSAEVQAWFIALTKVNHPGFEKIIAQGTLIELRDLGITQSREEFLASLDEWEDATKGAILLLQVVSSNDGVDIIDVCYRFESNEQLNRETYSYAEGKITHVVQEMLGDKCEGF